MLNEQIISSIDKIYNYETLPSEFDVREIKAVISNKEYYIRPGNDTTKFDLAFKNTIKAGEELGTQIYSMQKGNTPIEICIDFTIGYLSMLLIKNFFDVSYFEEQVEKFKAEKPQNQMSLKEYLFKFSKEQLKDFFEIINNFNINNCFFLSESNIYDMLQELNAKCYASDSNAPNASDIEVWTDFFEESAKLFSDYTGKFFDYLSTETIAGIIYKYIENKHYVTEHVAELLYTDGYDVAVKFITSYFS